MVWGQTVWMWAPPRGHLVPSLSGVSLARVLSVVPPAPQRGEGWAGTAVTAGAAGELPARVLGGTGPAPGRDGAPGRGVPVSTLARPGTCGRHGARSIHVELVDAPVGELSVGKAKAANRADGAALTATHQQWGGLVSVDIHAANPLCAARGRLLRS